TIYKGKSSRSIPEETSPLYQDATDIGFQFVWSGTDTYWANHETMHQFVDGILAPYIKKKKEELGLPDDQEALWSIDVWAVHRSKAFREWMEENHPKILLDYIPGGCT
ncbi:hypothetical protein EV360DRAFT_25954, partial [Lentinula raphanica]